MVTTPQIEKLSARIEGLADAFSTPQGGPDVVYTWKERGETEAQAFAHFYQVGPAQGT